MHEFPPGVTDQTIQHFYARARRRHDYLCGKLRKILRSRRPILIGVAPNHDSWDPERLSALRAALAQYNPDGSFFLVVEPTGGALEGDWRGDNGTWDRVLRPFSVPAPVRVAAQLQRLLRRPLANLPRWRRAAH